MRLLKSIAVLLLLCCVNLTKAQDIDYLKSKREADAFFTMEDYYNSIQPLKQMVNSDFVKRVDYFFLSISFQKLNKEDSAVKYMNLGLNKGLYFRDTNQIDANDYMQGFKKYASWEKIHKKLVSNYLAKEEKVKVTNQKLLDELVIRKEMDQRYRSLMTKEKQKELKLSDKELGEKMSEMDIKNTLWLDSVIVKNGWPGLNSVGREGDKIAWLIIQHADKSPEIQKKHLKTLQIEASKENTNASNVAYLTDRVLVNLGENQLYATQFKLERDSNNYPISISPKPLAYPEYVDDFRKFMGMSSAKIYLDNSLKHFQKKEPK